MNRQMTIDFGNPINTTTDRIHKKAKTVLIPIPSGSVKPKNKPINSKERISAINTLKKRIQTTFTKAENISTEVSGNYTPKRGREAEHRRNEKARLEKYGRILLYLHSMWEKDKMIPALKFIRSQQDVEFIFNKGFPTKPTPEHGSWYHEEYPAKLKKANKLGLFSKEDEIYVLDMLKDMGKEEPKSDEEIKKDKIRETIENLRGQKIQGFFPTPDHLSDYMIELVGLEDSYNVLEPEAGIGHIADRIRYHNANCKIVCCERMNTLANICELKGYTIASNDIFDMVVMAEFDRIIMNPPFEKGQDIEHVTYVFNNFLKKGGTLISIMSNGVKSNSQKKFQTFRDLVKIHGEFIELPAGQFQGAKAFNSTGVSTCLVILNK